MLDKVDGAGVREGGTNTGHPEESRWDMQRATSKAKWASQVCEGGSYKPHLSNSEMTCFDLNIVVCWVVGGWFWQTHPKTGTVHNPPPQPHWVHSSKMTQRTQQAERSTPWVHIKARGYTSRPVATHQGLWLHIKACGYTSRPVGALRRQFKALPFNRAIQKSVVLAGVQMQRSAPIS